MKTMKKNETKNPIETSTITFRFQTLKEVVRFLKTLPSAFPQATVAPAGGSPEVVVVTMDNFSQPEVQKLLYPDLGGQ